MKLSSCSLIIGASLLGALACGNSSNGSKVNGDGSGNGTGENGTSGSSGLLLPGDSAGSSSGGAGSVGAGSNPTTCSGSNTTTIEGFVYDPAGKNPLYNVSVYVPDPGSPLPDLDTVPLGCGCTQLYPAKVLATGNPTDATGHFSIPCAPSGTVSLVVQTGKWRRQYDGIAVTANQANMAPKLQLPADSTQGSLPNIAISTGGADSLECLPLRIGVSASEYVLGSATGGHMHIYTGYHGATMTQGSVDSYKTLWDQQTHLNEHDVVLLSCEGQETTGGTPGAPLTAVEQTYLMNYANAGGRVFASHFHYAWFNTGPFNTAPNKVATWATGAQHIDDTVSLSLRRSTRRSWAAQRFQRAQRCSSGWVWSARSLARSCPSGLRAPTSQRSLSRLRLSGFTWTRASSKRPRPLSTSPWTRRSEARFAAASCTAIYT